MMSTKQVARLSTHPWINHIRIVVHERAATHQHNRTVENYNRMQGRFIDEQQKLRRH